MHHKFLLGENILFRSSHYLIIPPNCNCMTHIFFYFKQYLHILQLLHNYVSFICKLTECNYVRLMLV